MHEDSVAVAAAKTMMLVLDVSPRDAEDSLQLNGRQMNRQQAILALVELHKPVACSAHVSASMLTLKCSELTAMQAAIHAEQIEDAGREIKEAIRNNSLPDTTILFRTSRRSMLLSGNEYDRWTRDYFVGSAYSRSVTEPNDDARIQGADVVVEFELQPNLKLRG